MSNKEYIASLDRMRRNNSEKMHNAAIRWNELANRRSSELSKHLFTIASLVLPLSLLPVTQEGFLNSVGAGGKIIMIASWSAFILSLIFGFVHLNREGRFFNMWAKQENSRSLVYDTGIFTTSARKAFNELEAMNQKSKKLSKMPSGSGLGFLYLQETFLVLGIILIGVVLALKLFVPSNDSSVKQRRFNQKEYIYERLPNWKKHHYLPDIPRLFKHSYEKN